jgi:hypothetical protein
MGGLFRTAEHYFKTASPDDIIVEIGTTRGTDGSTQYFDQLAKQKGTMLHSVDIDDRQYIFQSLESTVGYCLAGSIWATTVLPTLNKKISLLYLDNYDYDYNIGATTWVDDQKIEYQTKYNINLNNQDCVIEHLKQIIALLPYLAEHSTVICDDTYLSNGCWIGKCGAVVPYLVANGFSIVNIDCTEGSSYGVALKR